MNTTAPDTAATTTLFDITNIDTATVSGTEPTPPEQLTLLPSDVPLQFRLDERTRRAGLRHVAELRAQMAQQAASRAEHSRRLLRPTERQIAA